MTGGSLGEWVVQFSQQGIDVVQKAVDSLNAQFTALGASLTGVADLERQAWATVEKGFAGSAESAEAFKRQVGAMTAGPLKELLLATIRQKEADLASAAAKEKSAETARRSAQAYQQMAGAAGVVTGALGAVTGRVEGFVRQGLAQSVVGEILQIQFQRLSLAIAGLFRPELEKVTELVGRLRNWIEGLSESQRENLAGWLKAAAITGLVAGILPRVLAGVQALAVGFKALGAAITLSLDATGIGALLPLIGLAVGAMTAFLTTTESGKGILEELAGAFEPVLDAAKQIWESLQPLFKVLAGVLSAVLAKLGAALAAVANALTGPIAAIAGALAAALEPVGKLVAALAEGLGKAVEKLAASGYFEAIGSAIAAAVGLVGELADAFLTVWQALEPVQEVLIEILVLLVKGLAAVLKVVAAVVGAVAAAVKWLTTNVRELLGLKAPELLKPPERKPKDDRSPFAQKVGGFEAVEATFRRIAAKSQLVGRGGKDPAERTADTLDLMAPDLRRTADAAERNRPPVTR